MKLLVNNTHPSVPQDSIWGPAPARDFRQSGGNQHSESDSQKAKGKKKKKMQKIDSSILGFTCAADPDRINVGEIEADGTTKWADYIQETGFNQPQKLCIIWWWQQFLYYVWELGGSYWWLSMRCVCTVLSDRRAQSSTVGPGSADVDHLLHFSPLQNLCFSISNLTTSLCYNSLF